MLSPSGVQVSTRKGHFIAELQALRQRLQHEATRVEREVVQYASLNEAARASMRTISENLAF
jgi:hypothetical protein